jgi:hypothetical protein
MLKIFKKRIQKTKKLGFGCNKKTFEFEQQLHQKQPILQITKLKTFFRKEFL